MRTAEMVTGIGAIDFDGITGTPSAPTQGFLAAQLGRSRFIEVANNIGVFIARAGLAFHNRLRLRTNEIVEIIRRQPAKGCLLQPRSELDRSRDDDLTLPIQGDQVIAVI